jgi:hypothetical protein
MSAAAIISLQDCVELEVITRDAVQNISLLKRPVIEYYIIV